MHKSPASSIHALLTSKQALVLCTLYSFSMLAASSAAQAYQPPTMNFTQLNETMGGSPAVGVLGNTLYVAYRANDSSNSLWIDTSTDGATTTGPVNFHGIVLGSDPSIAGDGQNGLIQVAFKSASNDTMWICGITPPLSPSSNVLCTNLPTVHMMGAPSIANTNLSSVSQNGDLYVAYETSVNDNNGSNHLGFLRVSNSASGHGLTASYVTSTLIGSSPAITGFEDSSNASNRNFQVAFQANDASHRLFLQAFSPFISGGPSYGAATPFATQIGTTPAICNMDGYQNRSPMVAFLANDSSNHLWFEDFGYNPGGDSWYSGPAVQNNATIGGAPAVIAWYAPNGGLMITAAFKSNDLSNHLWIGSQQY